MLVVAMILASLVFYGAVYVFLAVDWLEIDYSGILERFIVALGEMPYDYAIVGGFTVADSGFVGFGASIDAASEWASKKGTVTFGMHFPTIVVDTEILLNMDAAHYCDRCGAFLDAVLCRDSIGRNGTRQTYRCTRCRQVLGAGWAKRHVR